MSSAAVASPAWFDPAAAKPAGLLRGPGGLTSVGVHVLIGVGIVLLAQQVRPVAEKVRTIELTLEQPPAPKPVEPPPPPPPQVKRLVVNTPPPAPQPLPQPKTVDAPAAQAETYTPPPAPPPTAVVPPPAPPVVAQAPAPAAPKVIEMAQIPADYVNQVFAQINGKAAYPEAAKRRRQEGRVGYQLTLSPSGQLIRFEIVPSGTPALDDAARDAIKAAAPFPRLPDLGGSAYLLSGAIVFRIA